MFHMLNENIIWNMKKKMQRDITPTCRKGVEHTSVSQTKNNIKPQNQRDLKQFLSETINVRRHPFSLCV